MRSIHIKGMASVNDNLVDYPTPINISYAWSFGSLAGLCLVIQIVTGILLAMHYTPHVQFAFVSVEHIIRDVNDGWLLRYFHANGASMFFIVLYLHITRSILEGVGGKIMWITGSILFLLTMATAFMGYILPWGQMSFWGATVITNLFAAIPYVGPDIAEWLWGGFSVDNPTLNRFFSLHYCLPFIIAALALIHIVVLHFDGSSDLQAEDSISFYPYFVVKDIFAAIILLILFCYLVFFNPNYLGHPDNYIMANNLVTPSHLVPEWYFLPFYAILRSTPDKLGGFINMFLSIALLFVDEIDADDIVIIAILGWLGQAPIEYPYPELSMALSWYALFYPFVNEVIDWFGDRVTSNQVILRDNILSRLPMFDIPVNRTTD